MIKHVKLSHSETFDIRRQREQEDPIRYYRLCSVCLRLRQFFHFSFAHANTKVKAKRRTCLDCSLRTRHRNNPQITNWYLGTQIVVCWRCQRYIMCDPNKQPMWGYQFDPQHFMSSHPCLPSGKSQHQVPDDTYVFLNHIRSKLEELEKELPTHKLMSIRSHRVQWSCSSKPPSRLWEEFFRSMLEFDSFP